MKSVSDEVLRQIGSNKDWTKRYGVVANLVKNPRTPLGLSPSNLVPRLNPRDMKTISVDRNVPEVIRKQAQKFVRQTGRPERREEVRQAWPTTTRSSASPRTASAAEVRKAYAQLARERHPDRFADPAEKARAEEFFKDSPPPSTPSANDKQPARVRRQPGPPAGRAARGDRRRTPIARGLQMFEAKQYHEAVELLRTAVGHVPGASPLPGRARHGPGPNPHWVREGIQAIGEGHPARAARGRLPVRAGGAAPGPGPQLRARKAAEAALRLDPNDERAHACSTSWALGRAAGDRRRAAACGASCARKG